MYDQDFLDAEAIGGVEFRVEQIATPGGLDKWFDIYYKGESAGKVHLRTFWFPDYPKVAINSLEESKVPIEGIQQVSSMKFASFNMDFSHSLTSSSQNKGNPLDLFVQIALEKPLLSPSVLNLNQKHNFHHWIYNAQTAGRPNRESLFMHTETIDNKRVLVVRTQYVIVNKTGIPIDASLTVNGKT